MITLWQSLCDQTTEMAHNAFSGIDTLDDWEKVRDERHREFMQSLGLDPLPTRCDLKLTDYGPFEGKGFQARRIAFQIMPDCWSSACLYVPDPLPDGKLPGVLYVCGHASIGTWHYQYHPILWARRGYACLIVDTIEQNDNPGEHHAYVMGKQDALTSLGYTPAGIEVWNAMRALDVLAADPRVDPARLAVTGVSGGGACSFHMAMADERVKAVSTLCGISSPVDAIVNRHLNGHCDCMYPLNLYRRDISEYAALLAPRAALFCFADDDTLFHAEETTALVERVRKIYRLCGEEGLCGICTCPGPHGDHPEFDEATSQWFDRHVAGNERPLIKRGAREIGESTVSVFNGTPPEPDHLPLLPQLIAKRGRVPLPRTPDEWPAIRRAALQSLPSFSDGTGGSTSLAPAGEWKSPGSVTRIHCGQVGGVDIRIQTRTQEKATRLILGVAREGENDLHAMAAAGCGVSGMPVAIGGFMPRIASDVPAIPAPEHLPPGSWLPSTNRVLRKALLLAGTTPVMMTIRDLGVAVDYLFATEELNGRELYLHGRGDAGVAALYQALLDERIAGVIMEDAVSSHLDGAPILGILRAMDIPQAIGLMAPRKVALVNAGHSNWTWPNRAYERLGCPERFINACNLREAMERMLE